MRSLKTTSVAVITLTALFSTPFVFADLTTDISTVSVAYQAQENAKAHEAAKVRAKAAKRAAAIRAERDRQAAIQLADKKRDQDYEDKLRTLQLKDKELDIKMKEARANRADEFVDVELAHAKAKIDKVQSEADANRLEAQGNKALKEKMGYAEIKAHSGFFK
ncbi:hypothetical protein A6A19_04815 [Actinobacillus delphinicola]|uniref:DUF5384 family protein n=1 Tax=Actinobacillus delphinicola TaxID=51161 RepID=UPI0024427447|nr:DUF5384 family protein [Actinobacillus delphinicola]MDG6897329.1 hypothetical protein [Actinobacillus delphinicola]